MIKAYKFNYLMKGSKEIGIIADNSTYSGCSDFQVILLTNGEVVYNSHNKQNCFAFMKNWEEIEISEKIKPEEIYFFEDWVNYMLSHSDYPESELMQYEEYYENLLTFAENCENFIRYTHNLPKIKP